MERTNPEWIDSRPFDGPISTSRTCPNCGTDYRDHMLAMSCQISNCGAAPFCRTLDDALENVAFVNRGKICAAFYQGLIFPTAQKVGNKMWKNDEFRRVVFKFCREVYDAAKHRPGELDQFAQSCMEQAYAASEGTINVPAQIRTPVTGTSTSGD